MTETEKHPYKFLDKPDTDYATQIRWQKISEKETPWPADFHYSNKRDWYKYLDQTNQGARNWNWLNDPYWTNVENSRFIKLVISRLELAENDRINAEAKFLSLNLREWGIKKEIVAHALCCYVVEMNVHNPRRAHPQVTEENRDSVFIEEQENFGFTTEEVTSVYGKIQHHFR